MGTANPNLARSPLSARSSRSEVTSISGFDPVLCASIIAEIGKEERFDNNLYRPYAVLRKVLVNHGVIKNDETIWRGYHLTFDVLPHNAWPNFVAYQISVRRIMTEFFGVFCKVRERVVDLADKQILTVVQSSNLLFCWFHAGTLLVFHPLSIVLHKY